MNHNLFSLTQGCHDISFDWYIADPCPEPSLSRGAIVDILDAPAKAWFNHPRLNPQPKAESNESKFDQGKAGHNLLLEGGDNILVISGYDDWKKKDAQEARKAAWSIGKIPLLQKQFDTVSAMAEAAIRQIRECTELEIHDLVTEGNAELTYIWQEKNGVWCRVRPDWTRKDKKLLLDYKTTGTSANPERFSRHMINMDYPIQDSFYRRGVRVVEGTQPEFVFIAQEDTPPYLCSFNGVDPLAESIAHEKVEMGIKIWGKCLKSGRWNGYPNRICWAEATTWQLDEWENKKKEMEDAA